jgi:hypothetical protein
MENVIWTSKQSSNEFLKPSCAAISIPFQQDQKRNKGNKPKKKRENKDDEAKHWLSNW